MGFIEDLKRQNAAKEEAERQWQKREEERRMQERKQKVEENLRYHDLTQKSKRYFDETGVRNLVGELHALGLAELEIHTREYDPNEKYLTEYTNKTYVAEVSRRRKGYGGSGGGFFIRTDPDGVIEFVASEEGSSSIPKATWRKDKSVIEEALGRAYNNPKREPKSTGSSSYARGYGMEERGRPPYGSGPCLPGNSLINIPGGSRAIKNLKNGDPVWTTDKFGRRIQSTILYKIRRAVSNTHKVAHVKLKDGRELFVSPGHPTIDYKEIGSLSTGQLLDNSEIISLKIIPYKRKYTYDILPAGDTGGYWANNVLIGSTLSSKFDVANDRIKPTVLNRQLSI